MTQMVKNDRLENLGRLGSSCSREDLSHEYLTFHYQYDQLWMPIQKPICLLPLLEFFSIREGALLNLKMSAQ